MLVIYKVTKENIQCIEKKVVLVVRQKHILVWKSQKRIDMDGSRESHTEWSKPDREWQISYDIAYMWDFIKGHKWTYLRNRNRVTDVGKETYVYQGISWGGINWEIGVDIYTLLYIK